jgi:hypothetical protein
MERAASMPRDAVLFTTPGILGRIFRAVARDLACDFSSLTA